jgi:hypothetical protein
MVPEDLAGLAIDCVEFSRGSHGLDRTAEKERSGVGAGAALPQPRAVVHVLEKRRG